MQYGHTFRSRIHSTGSVGVSASTEADSRSILASDELCWSTKCQGFHDRPRKSMIVRETKGAGGSATTVEHLQWSV